MKVFLSWSGDLSLKVAQIFRDWLPSVIQIVEPYVSAEDIDKGTRWSTDIAKELEASAFGILCVTRKNADAPWLNFEAGALSRQIDKSKVSPFLFDLKRSELKGPILQFQSTILKKDDIKKLLYSINNSCDESTLEESRLGSIFDVWWPKLEEQLSSLLSESHQSSQQKDKHVKNKDEDASSEIIEEILNLVRTQQKLLTSPEGLLPRGYLRDILADSGRVRLHPKAQKELELYYMDLVHSVNSVDLSTMSSEELSAAMKRIARLTRNLEKPISYILRGAHHGRLSTFDTIAEQEDDIDR